MADEKYNSQPVGSIVNIRKDWEDKNVSDEDHGNGDPKTWYHDEVMPEGVGTYNSEGHYWYKEVQGFPPKTAPNDARPVAVDDPGDEKNPPVQTGVITDPPAVPGGTDTPGKGVTAVNTEAMKTFAKNVRRLADSSSPLKLIADELDNNVNVRAGGFESAVKLGKDTTTFRDATKDVLGKMIIAINNVADGVNSMANHYDSAEEANKMSGDDYNGYLGKANGSINGLGGGGSSGGSGS